MPFDDTRTSRPRLMALVIRSQTSQFVVKASPSRMALVPVPRAWGWATTSVPRLTETPPEKSLLPCSTTEALLTELSVLVMPPVPVIRPGIRITDAWPDSHTSRLSVMSPLHVMVKPPLAILPMITAPPALFTTRGRANVAVSPSMKNWRRSDPAVSESPTWMALVALPMVPFAPEGVLPKAFITPLRSTTGPVNVLVPFRVSMMGVVTPNAPATLPANSITPVPARGVMISVDVSHRTSDVPLPAERVRALPPPRSHVQLLKPPSLNSRCPIVRRVLFVTVRTALMSFVKKAV